MKIYFARHGEYQNPNKVVPYRLPGYPLTDHGKEQIALIVSKLKDQKVRSLYTSPIERCVESAAIVGKELSLYPNQKAELIETGTPLQGLTPEALSIMSPNYPYDIPAHIEGGGETPEAIFERMNTFVEKLKTTSKNSVYVIFSHGDPIDIFLIRTLNGIIPHIELEFTRSGIRNIPMGGLVMLDYSQIGIPKYSEII